MYNPMFDTFAPVYMIESLADAGPVLLSKAVAPKRACDRYSDAAIDEMFPKHVFENITPEAIFDELKSIDQTSFETLMGEYARATSEVTRETVRAIVMGEDWKKYYSEYLDETFYYVSRPMAVDGTIKIVTWGKLYRENARFEAISARSRGDVELANFFDQMVSELNDHLEDERAARSRYMRKPIKW